MDSAKGSPSQVSAIAGALIGSASDKDADVRQAVLAALTSLGKHQHAVVLRAIKSSLVNHPKLNMSHRVMLLHAMNNILKESLANIESNVSLGGDLIGMVSEDLTKSKKIIPEWQGAASDVLVTLGKVFVNEVMGNLLGKLNPGTLPHFFVVQTFGNLAVANVFKIVPYLSHLLTAFSPILGLVKNDNMRWVFATCLGHFAEAILEYVVNKDKAPDPTISKNTFVSEISGTYDVLHNIWILTKEAKLRCAVVDALGKMSMVLDAEKLEDQSPRLIATLISLYRRQPSEPYPITKAISSVIAATSELQSRVLELNLDGLVTVLHGQICSGSGDVNSCANQDMVKNYNEVLRCFGILALKYSDMLVNFMLQKLDSRDEKVRVGSLVVLRHLINATPTCIESKKDVMVIGLMKSLSETSNRAKQSVTRIISAMATHGFLLQDGGEKFVEFIVRQCAYKSSSYGAGDGGNENENSVDCVSLQAMCDNVLYLTATTVDGMDVVLWPYLFEFMKSHSMTSATGIISRCLAYIAKSKRESQSIDYKINFSESVNIPSSFGIFARLLVLLACPHHPRIIPDNILDLLVNIGPIIHHNLGELWDSTIPQIRKFLKDGIHSGMWSQKGWDDQITLLLSASIDVVADEEWTCLLGMELTRQWELYESMPSYKNFSFKCMGVLLRKSSNREFVNLSLSSLFQSVKRSELAEREGAGICLGYAGSSHLDLALSNLDAFLKQQVYKKDGSLFGGIFKSDKAIMEGELAKGTAALCCGYAAYYASPDLVLSRVDAIIVKMLLPLFKSIKDDKVKENLVYASELIARSVHPNHLGNHPIHSSIHPPERHSAEDKKKRECLPSRPEILSCLQKYLRQDGIAGPSAIKTAVLSAMAELVKLDPILNDADVFQVVKITTEHVIGLPRVGDSISTAQPKLPLELLQEQCILGLYSVLREVIVKLPTPSRLDSVFKLLHTWLSSEHAHERERSLSAASRVFDIYFDAFIVTKSNYSLNILVILLSQVISHCCDPEPNLRKKAVECVQQLVRIQNKYNGVKQEENDEVIVTLGELAKKLGTSDPQKMYRAMKDVVKAVLSKIPNELTYFVDGSLTASLMASLLHPHSTCANGACITLHHIFKTRGGGFAKQVNQIVDAINNTLKHVTDGTTRTGVIKLMSVLAAHHPQPVLNALLSQPLPYTEQIVACWRALGADANLREPVTEHLLNLLSQGLPYDEKSKGLIKKSKEFTRTATSHLTAASCGLREVLESSSSNGNGVNSFASSKGAGGFHRTVAVCLIRIGSMRSVGPPGKIDINPLRQAIDALYCLIAATCTRDLCQFLEQNLMWNNLEAKNEDEFYHAIATFASGISRYRHADIADIAAFMNPFLSSVYEPQRVAVAAFYAQLVAESAVQNEILIEVIINGIRGRLVDPSDVVRRLCTRGLANIVGTSPEQLKRYGASLLNAMMAGMEDKHDPDDAIALESMTGLERYLNSVENTNIHAIFVNICLRVRPCFEKDNSEVRSTAVRLFGALSQCGVGPSQNAFNEQVHYNLIAILLHLNDDDESVRSACKITLQEVGSRLGSEAAEGMFYRVLLEDSELHYGEFANDLSKILVRDIPDKISTYLMECVSFYKSHWASIRSNAAMLTGFLMSNTSLKMQHIIAADQVCAALIQLLKDASPKVRGKAAEALSALHQY